MPLMESSGSEQARLTLKERELLALLEQNPGRCFSRSFLLERIWGYSNNARTRTVDVHVSRLRKKLDYRDDITIHTVVSQGYVLERLGEANVASLSADSVAAGARGTA
jgi:two-component system alkaline phosphatase synthesis response regulator PhoP